MRCYFLRGSHIVGVEMLPRGLSDPDAIARVAICAVSRRCGLGLFSHWDRSTVLMVRPGAPTPPAPSCVLAEMLFDQVRPVDRRPGIARGFAMLSGFRRCRGAEGEADVSHAN